MPSPEKARILVLHLTKYSDHSVVLHAVDAAAGRRSFLVRGLKRSGATAAFHSLALLEVVSGSSPKSSLSYLKEWTPAPPLPQLRSDLIKSTVALFISEVLYRSFTDAVADPALFDWLCEAVVALDAAEDSVANFPCWFLVGYAVRLGFMPDKTIEPEGIFPPDEAALFQQILRCSFPEALALPLSANRRQSFLRKMLQYLSYHLGATLESKSLDVLHDVLV